MHRHRRGDVGGSPWARSGRPGRAGAGSVHVVVRLDELGPCGDALRWRRGHGERWSLIRERVGLRESGSGDDGRERTARMTVQEHAPVLPGRDRERRLFVVVRWTEGHVAARSDTLPALEASEDAINRGVIARSSHVWAARRRDGRLRPQKEGSRRASPRQRRPGSNGTRRRTRPAKSRNSPDTSNTTALLTPRSRQRRPSP
jgi:hypothetical protein